MAQSIFPPVTESLADWLAHPKSMRRGSVSQRSMKCSKPGCACATDPKARHGPYLSLTRAVQGQTQSRFLTPQQAEIARRQIQAGQEFRRRVDAYWKLCEQWADQELVGSAASAEAAKKRGFKRASKPKSAGRSKS